MNQTPSTSARRLTYRLHRDGRDAHAIIEALGTHLPEQYAVESLAEFVTGPTPPMREVLGAIELLAPVEDPLARGALLDAAESRRIKVRRAALEALSVNPEGLPWARLVRRLRADDAYHVRIALVDLIAEAPEPVRWEIAYGADDPHWRVRKQVLTVVQRWAEEEGSLVMRERLANEITARGVDGDPARGMLAYLELYAHPGRSIDACAPPVHGEVLDVDLTGRPWWSEEPSLMRARLKRMSRDEVREEDVWLVWLMTSAEAKVRSMMMQAIAPIVSVEGAIAFLVHAAEPRRPYAADVRRAFLERVSRDRLDEAARRILEAVETDASLTALAGLPAEVREHRERVVAWAEQWLAGVLAESVVPPAEEMTAERARAILDAPELETSWKTLQRAANVCKVRLESQVPAEWLEPPELALPATPASMEVSASVVEPEGDDIWADESTSGEGAWWEKRALGDSGLEVTRMGISGHYALPERGFAEAMERGITTYFWEPIYLSQSRFFKSLPGAQKADVVMCCGTFEASAEGMRRDIERALRDMELERIAVFYVFWVRERERLSDELLREMGRCRRDGLVHTFGVTTHSRALAREFLTQWPAVMVRHNAAHTGAEREVFPHVDASRTGVTTFTNLCYGRMISELPGWTESVPSARDAYRYTLSHEGVTSCWSAPSTVAQLRHNLRALDAGPMTHDELQHMRDYGAALYRLNKGFDRFVRSR